MAINPTGSFVTLASSVLFISDIRVSFVTEFFDRLEFQHARLNSAPNSVGQHALKTRLLGDTPAQIVIGTLSFQDVVPLNPDVTVTSSNYDNIKRKFNIVRYEITGAPTASSSVSSVFTKAKDHIQQLAKFQSYIDKSSSMDTEYLELIALQAETFSYLTTTGISLSGNAVNSTVNNVLITKFEPDVAYEVIVDSIGNYQVLQSFTLVVEQRTISSKGVVS